MAQHMGLRDTRVRIVSVGFLIFCLLGIGFGIETSSGFIAIFPLCILFSFYIHFLFEFFIIHNCEASNFRPIKFGNEYMVKILKFINFLKNRDFCKNIEEFITNVD